jgi:hypothetical protein
MRGVKKANLNEAAAYTVRRKNAGDGLAGVCIRETMGVQRTV